VTHGGTDGDSGSSGSHLLIDRSNERKRKGGLAPLFELDDESFVLPQLSYNDCLTYESGRGDLR
jgi:hypothetical protein